MQAYYLTELKKIQTLHQILVHYITNGQSIVSPLLYTNLDLLSFTYWEEFLAFRQFSEKENHKVNETFLLVTNTNRLCNVTQL